MTSSNPRTTTMAKTSPAKGLKHNLLSVEAFEHVALPNNPEHWLHVPYALLESARPTPGLFFSPKVIMTKA
jgi:hypothetical protein